MTGDFIWATAVSNLTSEAMKFALNSATDTLPHNSNLARWYKGLHSGLCKLCGSRQTLLHVLNNCNVALKMRRYNERHDRVLSLIAVMTQSYLPATFKQTADLTEDTYRFPSHITPSNLRPYLVLWSDIERKLYIAELTICYETGSKQAEERKRRRYADMAEEADIQGYQTRVLPIQIGSRGVIQDDSLEDLRSCVKSIPQKTWQAFLEESHRIWCDRNKISKPDFFIILFVGFVCCLFVFLLLRILFLLLFLP